MKLPAPTRAARCRPPRQAGRLPLRCRFARPAVASTAPLPVFRTLAEPRLHWIIFDIGYEPRAFLIVTDPVVERFRLPECFPPAMQKLVGLFARVGLPTVQDATQSMLWVRPDHCMNMIGHHHPGVQFVAMPGKEFYCTRYQVGDFTLAHPAIAVAGIKQRFDFIAIPRQQFLLLVPGERTLRRSCLLENDRSLVLESGDFVRGQGTCETEGYEVNGAFTFKMRKLPAEMQAGKKPVGSFMRLSFALVRLLHGATMTEPYPLDKCAAARGGRHPACRRAGRPARRIEFYAVQQRGLLAHARISPGPFRAARCRPLRQAGRPPLRRL